jgi:hypothetical protein
MLPAEYYLLPLLSVTHLSASGVFRLGHPFLARQSDNAPWVRSARISSATQLLDFGHSERDRGMAAICALRSTTATAAPQRDTPMHADWALALKAFSTDPLTPLGASTRAVGCDRFRPRRLISMTAQLERPIGAAEKLHSREQ